MASSPRLRHDGIRNGNDAVLASMSGVPAPQGLRGRGILVTRPASRAAAICRLIVVAGGEPVPFPMLEILSLPMQVRLGDCIEKKDMINPDWLIFVSPTAVEQGGDRLPAQWLTAARLAAVGRATARALRMRGHAEVLEPSPGGGGDSEALAALPELQSLQGRRVLIVRGEGGREWLAGTLRGRGAEVAYAECYRRVRPQVPLAVLEALLQRWHSGGIAAVSITSREALDNLAAMLADRPELLRATPLFAAHPRIAEHARALGVAPVITTGAGDEAMVEGMQRFFATVA
jgi:uroporphyrinogen-III synthase